MSGKKVAIGIDMGTTKCCVGVVRDGKVEILENERSRKTTPSYVAFTDAERLVGEDAKDQATLNPTNTVFGVKRLLGRQFEDRAIQEQVPRCLPFVVDKNERRKPCIRVTYKQYPMTLFPEQVTAMLLTKMKKIAQTQLNSPIKDKMEELAQDRLGFSIVDSVISVPASFNNAQRQATKDAATIAGLKVLALINEPTAAAIAYQANRKEEAEETILVVDFGGGKWEASIVLVSKSAVKVKASFGCSEFGGSDIDNLIIELMIKKFRCRTQIDLSSNVKAKERLRGSCVHLKHTLSLLPEARVQLDCLSADTDFNETITRKEFEETMGPKTRKLLDQVHHVLSSYLKEHELALSKVLLVGGSTRIPLVHQWLEERFGSTKLDKTVNPDEAVAQGAALWAALLGGDNTVTDLKVDDVLRRPIVLEQDGKRQALFDQFASVPAEKKLSIKNWHQSTEFKLFETKSISENEPLLTLATFKRQWTLISSLKLEFSVNQSGICSVSQMSNGKKHQSNILILETLGLFQRSYLSNMIEVEELFERDRLKEQLRIAALSELESYCFKQKNHFEALFQRNEISKGTFNPLSRRFEDMIAWIDNSPSESEQMYSQKQLELATLCYDFLPKDDAALSERLLSKRSSSANVSAQTGIYDNPHDGKGISTVRKTRRDQDDGNNAELRQRRCASHSAQRSGKERRENPASVDRESRQGRNGEQQNQQKKSSSRKEKDERTRSLPRRDGSRGVRAKPTSREPIAAASHKSDEERARKRASDCKLSEEAMTGLEDRNEFVQHEEQRQDAVQRNDVGPPMIKPPLLPSGQHSTWSKNRSPRDQPGGDHGLHVVSSPGPSHGAEISGKYETQSRDPTEVQPDNVLKKSEQASVFTTNRSVSDNNEFTVQSFSLLDHGKHSSHTRGQPTSVVRSSPVIQEEMMTNNPLQSDDSESKQLASVKTSYPTERADSGDGADICYGSPIERPLETRSIGVQTEEALCNCYGRSIERPLDETRSICVQTESPRKETGQSLTVEAKPGSRDILRVAAGKNSETSDICDECHEKISIKFCGCTIASSLASSNKIHSTRKCSINGVGSSNSSYDPTKYTTQSKILVARDALQKIPSSTVSTHGVQYNTGTYTTAIPSSVLKNAFPVTSQDETPKREEVGRYRDTATVASLAESSSVVGRPYTLKMSKHEIFDDHRDKREAVDEIRVGTCYESNVKSAMVSRADIGLDSDPVIGSRLDPGMNTERPRTTSSSIRTRSRSRAECLFDKPHSSNFDPKCMCGSHKGYCSDCRSIRPIRKDILGKASAVPSSSVLVREAMSATSSGGSNLVTDYVGKRISDTLHDDFMNYKCHCGSGSSTCVDCYLKYILERSATSTGATNTRHLNTPGYSSSVPSPYDSASMLSHDSSKRTQTVYTSRESPDLTHISYHCVCFRMRPDFCGDCYLERTKQRRQLNY